MTPLEPAAEADIDALVRLVNGAYRGEEAKQGWATEAEYITGPRVTRRELETDLADPGVRLLVLRHEAAPDGLLGCVRLETASSHVWALGMLSVRPLEQAQGTGRRLLEAAEDMARAAGVNVMRMQVVHIREALIAWYERRGYADTGLREPYPYAGALVPGLQFVGLEKAL